MKRTQRWISLVLCVAMVFTVLPTQVLAASRTLSKSRSASTKTYSDAIKPGDFLILGNYNGHPLLWTVVNSAGGEVTLFCSEVLFEGEIDASMHEVIAYANLVGGAWEGDSNWHTSDIRNYLNSDEKVVSYKGASKNELPSYSSLPGFLNNFTQDELSLIVDTTHKSHIQYHRTLTDKDGGSSFARIEMFDDLLGFNENAYRGLAYKNTTEKFFLPDAMDLKRANENIGSMMYMEYAYDTANGQHYAPAYREGFWLREPVISGSNYLFWGIYFLDTFSSNGAGYAVFKRGIRPMCNIQFPYKQTLSGEGTLKSPYEINHGDNEAQKVQKPQTLDVPNGKYCIRVVDENGAPLSGVTVRWDDFVAGRYEEYPTDKDGCVFFSQFTVDLPIITATKTEYITWTNKNTNWQKNKYRYDTIVLYSEESGSLKLKEAHYSNNGNNWPYDLLTQTKRLSIGNDLPLAGDLDRGNFFLSCAAYDTDVVSSYELWQGEAMIAESPDGQFVLSSDDFEDGAGCFIRVKSVDGKSIDTHINLEFAEMPINKENSLDLSGGKIKFGIADDVPFLGGSTLSVDLAFNCPVSAYIDDDGKVQIGFNVNLAGGDSDKEILKDTKKLITDARKASKTGLSKSQRRKFKSLMKKKNDISFLKNGEFNLLGYAELDPGGCTATGYIMMEAKIDVFDLEYNTVIVVVPVTIQVEFGMDAYVGAGVTYDWENATFLGNVDLGFSGTLKAFGGVGVSKLVGVGAYGSAILSADSRIIGSPKGLQSVDLTGELGLKAYFGIFKYERPFAYNTWNLYSANSIQLLTLDDRATLWNSILDASAYQLQDLSYLEEESDWLGEEGFIELMATTASGAKTQFSNLLQNTYRNAQPVMVATEDAVYVAFLHANSETGNIYVVTAKYDGESWFGTVKADANALLDDAPSLCVDKNGTIHLAYARTNSSFDGETLLSYAQNQSIVVGTLDPDTLEFTEAKEFSAKGYANKQQLVLIDGTPTLVWLDAVVSDDNSVLFPESADICYAEYRSGKWSSLTLLASVNQTVLSMVPGEVDSSLAVGYIADTDGDSATTDDYTLYEVTEESITEIANGVMGKISYGAFPGSQTNALLWNDSSYLCSALGDEIAISGITNEYEIVNDRIYFSAAEEDSANLCVIQYEDDNWSLPMTLTDEDRYLENLSVISWNGEDYVLGMHTLATIYSDSILDTKNLVWSKVAPVNDLKLESVDYDASSLEPGEETELTLSIVNAGEGIVENIDIYIDDTLVSTETIDLYPGENAEIVIEIECPDALKMYDVSIAEPDINDYTPEDNTFAITVGYSDVSIAMVYEQIGEYRAVLAYVTNDGVDIASGHVAFYDDNHYFMGSGEFADLPVGETIVVTCILSDAFVGNGDIDISAEVICAAEDLYGYNNVATVHIGEITYATEAQLVRFDGKTATSLITCAPGTHNTALLAAYSARGQMLEAYAFPLDEGVNQIKQNIAATEVVCVRVFLLNKHYEPQGSAVTEINRNDFRAEFAEALANLTYARNEDSLDIYADAEMIDTACADAVLRMFNLGLMLGDGKCFNPVSAISRAELARMIYIALNGGIDDGAVDYADEDLFSDVTADDWYAGYANYCAENQLGPTSGNFDGMAHVTVPEAAKMLLCAMGYSAEECGFTGAGWAENVIAAAEAIDLLDGFNYSTTTYIPRQWLAVMFCNAIDKVQSQ